MSFVFLICKRRFFDSVLLVSLAVSLFSCALPRPEYEVTDFVSLRDREIVSLSRQGLDYVRRGRLIDAELNFEQKRS